MRSSPLARTCAAALCAFLAVTGTAVGQAHAASAESSRVAGADRYATSVAMSKAAHPGSVATAFVVSGENFPDAVAAGAAAGRMNAPVLLTRKDSLPTVVEDELRRLRPAKVVVVGGDNAVSETTYRSIVAVSTRADRVAGPDRYATAALLADYIPASGEKAAYVASGEVFPDALAAGPAAVRSAGPVLLTRSTQLPKVTSDVIYDLGNTPIRVVGGGGVIADTVLDQVEETTYAQDVRRVAGPDRYATSAAVSADAFATAGVVYIASGQQYPDALAGVPLASRTNSPILLVRKDRVDTHVCQEIARLKPGKVVALGGEGSLAEATLNAAVQCANTATPQPSATSAPNPGTGPGVPAPVCTSNGADTLDRATARASFERMLSVIPAADAARFNPADPIADEIYILEAEAANLTRAGAPDVCQQAYYVSQVKYMHEELLQAKTKLNEAEAHYDRARTALGTVLPLVNPVLATNYQLP